MAKPAMAYRLKSFSGVGVVFLLAMSKTHATIMLNNVSYIHVRDLPLKEFERDYKPVQISPIKMSKVLDQWKTYAVNVGMSSTAAPILPQLVAMTKEEVKMATENGAKTEGKILDSAAAEHAADTKKGTAGKAPRKLAGAALKAVQAKQAREAEAAAAATKTKPARKQGRGGNAKGATDEERIAAEAKLLAEDVTKDINAGSKQAEEVVLGKRKAAPKAATPGKAEAARVLKGKETPAAGTKTFDPSTLKNADGKWKSSSAMFKGLLWEGKLKTDDQIFAAVQKQFDLDDTKKGYVAWNRGWFRRNGIALPAAK
jgi:hypothetical protein